MYFQWFWPFLKFPDFSRPRKLFCNLSVLHDFFMMLGNLEHSGMPSPCTTLFYHSIREPESRLFLALFFSLGFYEFQNSYDPLLSVIGSLLRLCLTRRLIGSTTASGCLYNILWSAPFTTRCLLCGYSVDMRCCCDLAHACKQNIVTDCKIYSVNTTLQLSTFQAVSEQSLFGVTTTKILFFHDAAQNSI